MLRPSIRSTVPLAALVLCPLGAASAQSAASPQLSDANIAAIVVVANTIDIEYAKIAQQRTRNPEVRKFAETMVRDHDAVNKQATELATKLKLTPVENEVSRKLAADAGKTRAELRAKSDAEFDRAYIANEVAYHQAVLDAIDQALIPSARNAELKALLQAVRPAVAGHLQHAKQLQAALERR